MTASRTNQTITWPTLPLLWQLEDGDTVGLQVFHNDGVTRTAGGGTLAPVRLGR